MTKFELLTTQPYEHQPKGTHCAIPIEEIVGMNLPGYDKLIRPDVEEDQLTARVLDVPEAHAERLHGMLGGTYRTPECHSFAERLVLGKVNFGISTYRHSELVPVKDIDDLQPDKVYRVTDERHRITHSMVGMPGEPDKNIAVLGEWGKFAVSSNREALAAYGQTIHEAIFSGGALTRIRSLL